MTEWRCENVPRCESCPERRTGKPSSRSDPKEIDSASAQSIFPLVNCVARACTVFASFGCARAPAGIVESTPTI